MHKIGCNVFTNPIKIIIVVINKYKKSLLFDQMPELLNAIYQNVRHSPILNRIELI